MKAIATGTRIAVKDILFLTDFSEPLEVAIPFAIAIAREYDAKVHALHVMTPVPLAYAIPESTAAVIDGLEKHFCLIPGAKRIRSIFLEKATLGAMRKQWKSRLRTL